MENSRNVFPQSKNHHDYDIIFFKKIVELFRILFFCFPFRKKQTKTIQNVILNVDFLDGSFSKIYRKSKSCEHLDTEKKNSEDFVLFS